MSEDKEKFEVKDRRKALLDEDESAEDASAGKGPAKEAPPKEAPRAEGPPREPTGHGAMPPLDFIAFIGSLGANALMAMGDKLVPEQPDMEVNLPAAQQMIDILDMLKEKTKGNLDSNEQSSLDNLLYNLKMRFAHAVSGK